MIKFDNTPSRDGIMMRPIRFEIVGTFGAASHRAGTGRHDRAAPSDTDKRTGAERDSTGVGSTGLVETNDGEDRTGKVEEIEKERSVGVGSNDFRVLHKKGKYMDTVTDSNTKNAADIEIEPRCGSEGCAIVEELLLSGHADSCWWRAAVLQ